MINDYDAVYELGGECYTATEAAGIVASNRVDEVETVFGYRALSTILRRGGMPILSKKIDKIADLFENSISGYYSTGTEKQQAKNRKKYVTKTISFMKKNNFFFNDISDFLKRDLIFGTFRSTFQLFIGDVVNLSALTDEQCVALAKNFKRAMKGKDMVPYHASTKSI